MIQDSHFLNSNLIKFNQPLAQWHTLVDKYGIKVFHIG